MSRPRSRWFDPGSWAAARSARGPNRAPGRYVVAMSNGAPITATSGRRAASAAAAGTQSPPLEVGSPWSSPGCSVSCGPVSCGPVVGSLIAGSPDPELDVADGDDVAPGQPAAAAHLDLVVHQHVTAGQQHLRVGARVDQVGQFQE